MKKYIFKKDNLIVNAHNKQEAYKIYNQFTKDNTDVGVADFLRRKGVKFTKVNGVEGKTIIEFDNERDWTLGSKELRNKYNYKSYESRKEGNTYKVILEDSNIEQEIINELKKVGLTLTPQAKRDIKWNIIDYLNNSNLTVKQWVKMIISGKTEDVSDLFEKTGSYTRYFTDAKIAYYEVLWYEGKNEREAMQGDFKTKEFKTESQAMAFYRSIKNDNGKFAFWVTGRSSDGDVLKDLVY